MFDENQFSQIESLLITNIEIIEQNNKFNDEFEDNTNRIEEIISHSYILKEEITILLKLKMLIRFMRKKGTENLNIIKQILIHMLEINEFKRLVQDNYGIGKEGYWSFRKEFRQKELEIFKLESEFYLKTDRKTANTKPLDRISLKFKKSLDKTYRRGWL